jgi:LmbE family N-acetylglucosaminyl deacetylase
MRILVVYAHPDDESFGPAALLAKYAREGAQISGLVATRGEHGQTEMVPPPSPPELGRLRERDLRDAAAVIGFARVDLLDYEDGTLASVPPAVLEAQILDAIRRDRPDVLLTFGPGGITGHPDHLAIHRAATAAFHRARQEGLGVQALYYDAVPPERAEEMHLAGLPDGQPNTWIDVTETFPIKLEALRRHARHVQDAREMVERLEREPQTCAPLYRAWPPDDRGKPGLLR